MKDAIICKLATQCEDLYADALKQMQRDSLRSLWEREWVPTVAGKQSAFHGLAMFHQSLVAGAAKRIGEQIAWLQKSVELLKAAQTRSGIPNFYQTELSRAERSLQEAKKDNDFIYHERVPDIKTLPPLEKAQVAKPSPMLAHWSSNFQGEICKYQGD